MNQQETLNEARYITKKLFRDIDLTAIEECQIPLIAHKMKRLAVNETKNYTVGEICRVVTEKVLIDYVMR